VAPDLEVIFMSVSSRKKCEGASPASRKIRTGRRHPGINTR
jgi:hypothetical protein